MGLLQSHVQGKVRQPGGVALDKGIQGPVVAEAAVGGFQNGEPAVVELAKIHLSFVIAPVHSQKLLLGQQMLPDQGIQIDQIGVARIGRAGLVGGISIPRGAQGQQLPGLLAGFVEEVQKRIGIFAHGAHAVGPGQRGDMHENTGFAHN